MQVIDRTQGEQCAPARVGVGALQREHGRAPGCDGVPERRAEQEKRVEGRDGVDRELQILIARPTR